MIRRFMDPLQDCDMAPTLRLPSWRVKAEFCSSEAPTTSSARRQPRLAPESAFIL